MGLSLNILYLYAEMVPSWLPTFAALVENHRAQVHVVHWDHKRKTPYVPPTMSGVTFYQRSKFDSASLMALIERLDPAVIFVSGWMDRQYLKAIWKVGQGRPVVSGFDDWWNGSLRQRIGSLVPHVLRRRLFTHAWVAGPRQYEFVKRIGFLDHEIIYNLLTADTKIFSRDVRPLPERANAFLYVGRFSPEKGIATLIAGFRHYREKLGGSWTLRCVGNGPLAALVGSCPGSELIEFVDPHELAAIHQDSQVLVVPSDRDYFPLVVQEAAASGLPILWSSNVGSATTFCLNGYNGYDFPAGDAVALAGQMMEFERLQVDDLAKMGHGSRMLSLRNSPEICAASLMSVVRNYK